MPNRPREVYYEKAEERELLLYRICEYLRGDDCRQCPATVDCHGDTAHPMCRELAKEAIAIVIEDFAERPEGQVKQDNDPRRA